MKKLKIVKKFRKKGTRRKTLKVLRIPRTPNQYFSMPDVAQEKWNRVTQAISKMRTQGYSLTKAAKEFAVAPRSVVELGKSAIRKQKNGRYAAKKSDQLLRLMLIHSPEGMKEVAIRGSRTASKIAEHSEAVRKYIVTGDSSKLLKFNDLVLIDANGQPIILLIDRKQLNKLASAGVLSFESLYRRVA